MFRVQSISLTNYHSTNDKASGTATIIHDGKGIYDSTEIKIQLQPEDCARILEVFQDRIQQTLTASANAMLEAQTQAALEPPAVDPDSDDEIQF